MAKKIAQFKIGETVVYPKHGVGEVIKIENMEIKENNKLEKNEIEKIVLVKVPSEIYAELRKIFVSLFENSGFRDIKISEKVDFQKLYEMKKFQ